MGILDSKCKHWKDCEWYDKENRVCEKDGGAYSMDGFEAKVSGCYIYRNKKLEEKKKNKKKNGNKNRNNSINDLQPFTKYLLVGIAVTILSIFFSWLFIDILGVKALWTSLVLIVAVFLFKYHSYTKINLIHKKFVTFLVIEISSLIIYVTAATILIDYMLMPTLFVIPGIIGILFLCRFAALHWFKIIKN